jgi:endonuclease YncB( thermonuclease family)
MTAMRPHSVYSIAPGWLAHAAAFGVMVILIEHSAAQGGRPCALNSVGDAQVVAVRDGRSLTLADGREVRLAGIEVPLDDTAAETARAALAAMTVGRPITLKNDGTSSTTDRYGRLPAFVYVGQDTLSAQENLLARGYARVAARVEETACLPALIASERAARRSAAGLWNQAVFSPKNASDSDGIAAAKGQFAVLEGVVISVREVRSVIYMNFGRRIGRDFTVTILKRNERNFTAAGLTPKALEGKRVRVRGYIEQRRGPQIEATRPEQIEVVELN